MHRMPERTRRGRHAADGLEARTGPGRRRTGTREGPTFSETPRPRRCWIAGRSRAPGEESSSLGAADKHRNVLAMRQGWDAGETAWSQTGRAAYASKQEPWAPGEVTSNLGQQG